MKITNTHDSLSRLHEWLNTKGYQLEDGRSDMFKVYRNSFNDRLVVLHNESNFEVFIPMQPLVAYGIIFRDCPVVLDDFPKHRDNFDTELEKYR